MCEGVIWCHPPVRACHQFKDMCILGQRVEDIVVVCAGYVRIHILKHQI